MLRRLSIFAVLVAAAGTTGVVLSGPAFAAESVFCVNNPVGVTCDQEFTSLKNALTAASGNSVDTTVRVAPGNYGEEPYVVQGPHHVTLQGSGQGATFIQIATTPAFDTTVKAIGSTVEDLTITMGSTNSDGDIGLDAGNATIQRVTVNGANSPQAFGMRVAGSSVSSSTVVMERDLAADTRGIYSTSAATVTDTDITATTGYHHSSVGTVTTLSRVSIKASYAGVSVQAGSVVVDDAVIELDKEAGGAGLLAYNGNPGTAAKSILANHATIVGGGSSSAGARAWAVSATAVQDSTIQLDNSVVFGPSTSLDVKASNNGALGSNSTATITTSYSVWSTENTLSGTGGTATIASGAGHLDVDPSFANPAGSDYRLISTSPVIDRGAPGTGAPSLDLDQHARVLDGNGDGVAVRDMGAYEAPQKAVVPNTSTPDRTAPDTAITAHPHKRLTKRRAAFRFSSNETQVTFQCRLDKKTWIACTSPATLRVTRGWHVFRVRARDAAGNLDPTPASFRFHRV